MRGIRVLVTLTLGAALAVATASPGRDRIVRRPREPGAQAPLLGVLGPNNEAAVLARFDPRTLRPLLSRSVPLAGHLSGWSFSPGRTKLVLGSNQEPAELRFVDTRRMRLLGDLKIGTSGLVAASVWFDPTHLLALVASDCCGGQTTLVRVDPGARRVLGTQAFAGPLQGAARTRDRLVLLLAPFEAIGPATLAVVDPEGHVDSVTLAQIEAGSKFPSADSGATILQTSQPALAVDPDGGRAYVVAAGAPVAEVDLRSLAVGYHALSEPVSLLGRLRNWLEPAAEAKGQNGPQRQALWLGDGLLAVSGSDYRAWVDDQGQEHFSSTPAGLKLIDTHGWSVRTLDRQASSISLAGGVLLATGQAFDSTAQTTKGSGLTAYSLDGRQRFHLFGDEPAFVMVLAGYGYVQVGQGNEATVIDLASGKTVRRLRQPLPFLLLGEGQLSG